MGLNAIVFDWAGTMVDHGSRAPMGVLVSVFSQFGVALTIEEARGPMGLPKRRHIGALLADPAIAARWARVHGAPPTERDGDRVYEAYVPQNAAQVADYAELIPGALETVAALRRRGLRIGSTTGYTREIMQRLLPAAARQGYAPDNLVCAGDLAEGRPTPLMMYRTFLDLGVWPAASVVKVDDTLPGIAEGIAAGCWTVGVTLSGNCVGLSRPELDALDDAQRNAHRARATAALLGAGAHYAVDSIAELLPAIGAIEARLARGERP